MWNIASLLVCDDMLLKNKVLYHKHFLSNTRTDREHRILEAMIKSKPEMYVDEYQDCFQTITGTQISIAPM